MRPGLWVPLHVQSGQMQRLKLGSREVQGWLVGAQVLVR
jgi:hypothetical protein